MHPSGPTGGVGAVVRGKYIYMRDLAQLDACRQLPGQQLPPQLGAEVRAVLTPLRVREWERALRDHPDKEYTYYLLRGMREGFRVGFERARVTLKSATKNMRSAAEEPDVVEAYLAKERGAGRIIGTLRVPQASFNTMIHVSRFGVIPKPHQPGKWRIIVDLSHPEGRSVNDGVEVKLCSLAYASIDDAAATILRLGRFTELAKLDIASAYRVVPVHPDDRLLLGMRWKGEVFVDSALPFGLRSAPKVFNSSGGLVGVDLAHQGGL